MTREASVRGLDPRAAWVVEEQGVVGPDGNNQQHADQVQDGELCPEQHQACGDCQYRECQRRYDARGAGGRAQKMASKTTMPAKPASDSRTTAFR